MVEAGLQVGAGLFLVPGFEVGAGSRLGRLGQAEARPVELQGGPLGRDEGQWDGLSEQWKGVARLESMRAALRRPRLELGLRPAHPIRFAGEEFANGGIGQLQRRADDQRAVSFDDQRQRAAARANQAEFGEGEAMRGSLS